MWEAASGGGTATYVFLFSRSHHLAVCFCSQFRCVWCTGSVSICTGCNALGGESIKPSILVVERQHDSVSRARLQQRLHAQGAASCCALRAAPWAYQWVKWNPLVSWPWPAIVQQCLRSQSGSIVCALRARSAGVSACGVLLVEGAHRGSRGCMRSRALCALAVLWLSTVLFWPSRCAPSPRCATRRACCGLQPCFLKCCPGNPPPSVQ